MNSSPKQVIIIMTDQQRKDLVSCYGIKEMLTPNIDSLAKEGVKFESAYCCTPVCSPSRAGMFTGVFPHGNGMLGNDMPLGNKTLTLGQRLQKTGIKTGYIGKWHLDASDYFGTGICPDGWDQEYWYDMRNYLDELTPEERSRSRIQGAHDKVGDVEPEFTFAHRCADRAVKFIKEHKNESYLLVVSFDEPHHPCLCPKEYVEKFEGYQFPKSPNIWDDLKDKPEIQKRWAGDRVNEDKDAKTIEWPDYFGSNHFVDMEIGRVVDQINMDADGAMVIYTADHGDMNNSHSLHAKGPAMYEEITNVPFIVRWKENIENDTVCDSPVSQISVVPTILDLFNIDIPETLDGKSILSTLTKQEEPIDDAFMEFNRFGIAHEGKEFELCPIRCCRDKRYKLAINLFSTDELYDLDNDKAEMNNLINSAEHAGIRNELHDKIINWMRVTEDLLRGDVWRLRPWRNDLEQTNKIVCSTVREEEGTPCRLAYGTGLPIA